MGHQENRFFPAMGFLQNRAIEFRDRSIDLIEQFQKFFASPADPRSQAQAQQLGAALLGEQLFLATEPQACIAVNANLLEARHVFLAIRTVVRRSPQRGLSTRTDS